MRSNNHFTKPSLVTGITLALSVLSGSALADQVNPFSMTELSQGYSLAAAEGKCGEGKCGGDKAKAAEAKCGGDKAKAAEGKCGADKDKAAEGKCGGAH